MCTGNVFLLENTFPGPLQDSMNPHLLRGLGGLAEKMPLAGGGETEQGQAWPGTLSFDPGVTLNLCVVLGFSCLHVLSVLNVQIKSLQMWWKRTP